MQHAMQRFSDYDDEERSQNTLGKLPQSKVLVHITRAWTDSDY
jgi:hypothetical protein